jgi:5-methylcytosine-specific restriction protein A
MHSDHKDGVAAAEKAMTRTYPDLHDRFFALKQLLESAAYADKVATAAWAVTLKRNGFRLNVGITEVLVGFPEGIGLNLAAQPDEFESSEGGEFFEVNYAVRPRSTRYNGLVIDFEQVAQQLQEPHFAFIDACARTRSGKPLAGSVNLRFHSAGLMAYARSFVADQAKEMVATVPEPRPDERTTTENFSEGTLLRDLANEFKRNAGARKACIAHYGLACAACGFEFGARYGAVAASYIHVHHLTPLSAIRSEHRVDPFQDLRPVCANCHTVIHMRAAPYTIEEMKTMLTTRGAEQND